MSKSSTYRPYFYKQASEMQQLFATTESIETLRCIYHELGFRKTDASRALRQMCKNKIAALGGTTVDLKSISEGAEPFIAQASPTNDRQRKIEGNQPDQRQNQKGLSDLSNREADDLDSESDSDPSGVQLMSSVTTEELDIILESLDRARTKLLDKTRRNRLLNYREMARDIAVVDELPDQVFSSLVEHNEAFEFDSALVDDDEKDSGTQGEGEQIRELPRYGSDLADLPERYQDDRLQTPYSPADLERKLRRLFLEHRTLIEETGANNLFLAFGFLNWKESSDSEIGSRAPLILVPVRLERARVDGEAIYRLHFDDEALDTNYSLYEKLRAEFDITLPELTEDQSPEEYWSAVESALGRRSSQGWQVQREMVLGLFRFSKQVMWHDLDPTRWPNHSKLQEKPVLTRILLGADKDDEPPGIRKEIPPGLDDDLQSDVRLIMDADPSQHAAIQDALKLKSGLVIEGPPGTGKSQSIANLIAAALDQGKSVLFLAEKMAALDVVFRRLDAANLGEFCLQLHGLKTSKREILSDLGKRMRIDRASTANAPFSQEMLLRKREKLQAISKALRKDVGPELKPLHQVIWETEKLRQQLPETYSTFAVPNAVLDRQEFHRVSELAKSLGLEWAAIPQGAREAWAGWIPCDLTDSVKRSLEEAIIVTQGEIEQLAESFSAPPLLDLPQPAKTPTALRELAVADPTELLPEFPNSANYRCVRLALQTDQLGDLEDLLRKLDAFLNLVAQVSPAFDYWSEQSEAYCAALQTWGEDLERVCSPGTRVGEFSAEAQRYERVLKELGGLAQQAEPVTKLTETICRTLADYGALLNTAEELCSGPSALSTLAKGSFAKPQVAPLVEQATARHKALIKTAEQLHGFDPSGTSNLSDLREANRVFRARSQSLFPWLSSEYRAARRLISSYLVDQKPHKGFEFLSALSRFIEYCEEQAAFKNDERLKEQLGPAFQGMATDWKMLDELVGFGQNLAKRVGVEKACGVLEDWFNHIGEMQAVKAGLQTALGSVQVFKNEHPIPSALWDRPISSISEHLMALADRLKRASSEVSDAGWCSHNLSLSEFKAIVGIFRSAKSTENELLPQTHDGSPLSAVWDRATTNHVAVKETLVWLRAAGTINGLKREILLWASGPSGFDNERAKYLIKKAKLFKASERKLYDVLELNGELDQVSWQAQEAGDIQSVAVRLESRLANLDYLDLIARWGKFNRTLQANELGSLCEAVTSGTLAKEEARDAFRLSALTTVVAKEVEANEELAGFTHTSMKELRKEFAELDRQQLKFNSMTIRDRLIRARVPRGVGRGRVSQYTQESLLKHEISKRQRHIPIRSLVKRAGNALQALKPCFLMSPLSVAQYLPPGEIEFDLVVMDEASQIRPEDALGALARARRVVIVGDPKQLPPTSFFDAQSADYEEEEAAVIDDTESILDVSLKQLPFRRLQWHYRSKHESLIQFSNDAFYERDLIVLPSREHNVRHLGVHYTFIEQPSYKRGRNHGEAEVVVTNVINHLLAYPGKTLGVAAFNKRQAEDIQLLFDKAVSQSPELQQALNEQDELEPLFIKNLENVQGDERDVIFISTTYGPEEPGGPVAQRFGPINSDLGWRRLNVIATRAKERVEVFSSLRPTDIHIDAAARDGKKAFRGYIEYAATGRVTEPGLRSGRSPDSDFEVAVGKIIKSMGYTVHYQVGVAGFFIDLGVVHPDRPGEYLVGIECDGAPYHSSLSIRDRDRLRQEILESKGWSIHRIWSTSWYHSRTAELNRLETELQRLLDKSRADAQSAAPEPELEIDHTPSRAAEDADAETDRELNEESLLHALERFWEVNIKPEFPERGFSILSPRMVRLLAEHKPNTKEEWQAAIPLALRERVNREEAIFMTEIFEIIEEYS